MSDAPRLKNYLGWDHKQERGKDFDEPKKGMQATLQHLFDDKYLWRTAQKKIVYLHLTGSR